ncbi:MAG: fibronectin type III domain-containing protein [Bacteroidota bacterium]
MKKFLIICICALSAVPIGLEAQSDTLIESPSLTLSRGKLWHSVFNGKSGPNFANWGRRGVGLDWPGFDETWINEDIGGPASYLATGGLMIGAKKQGDSIIAVEDWSIYGSTISTEVNSKYKLKIHRHLYPNGENWGMVKNKKAGEEVIETVWEYNPGYFSQVDQNLLFPVLPVRVTRRVHQWNGSKRDENYIIYDYVIKNISNEFPSPNGSVVDTLFDLRIVLNYALQANSRAWTVLFPQLSPGSRNLFFDRDSTGRVTRVRAGDYKDEQGDESFMYASTQGYRINGNPSGEFLAPAIAGVKLLYASPESRYNEPSLVSRYGWSAGSNSVDLSGPLTNIGSLEARYNFIGDISRANAFVTDYADPTYAGRARMWSMMQLGPWTIAPGDSIRIGIAEIVDGPADSLLFDAKKRSVLTTEAPLQFTRTMNFAQQTWQFNFDHPDPPVAPPFDVDYIRTLGRFSATEISWGTENETIPDPDDGTLDLIGYRLYRSYHLPTGPWIPIGDIKKGDPVRYNGTSGRYSFIDSTGDIGTNYYYALTAYDTGKASWPISPGTIFQPGGTASRRVPPLESSIFANRMSRPFRMTIAPSQKLDEILVVPNPFIIAKGASQAGSGDDILFTNVPNPCTLRIYTVRGDLVKVIDIPDGAGGIVSWNQQTDFGQFAESGIYIFHVDSPLGKKVGKFAIIR